LPNTTAAPSTTATPNTAAAPNTTPSTHRKPITYVGTLVSQAKLGHTYYDHAQIFLVVEADRSTALPYQDATSSGYTNSVGHAQLILIQGSKIITAAFAPNQLYVYYDKTHGSVGFGSHAGGRGYPFSVTRHEDPEGLVENSSIGAITDILSGAASSTDFSPAVPTLETDLTNETALSGGVSSCVAFDPATSICSNLNPLPLKTSAGDFYLYEPYTDDETTTDGSQPFTINWGTFWSQIP
jgi:hypothetical protein